MNLEEKATAAARQGGAPPMTLLIDLAREVDALKENAMRPDPPAPNTQNTGRAGKYRPLVPPETVRRDSRLLVAAAGLGGMAVIAVEAVLAWLI